MDLLAAIRERRERQSSPLPETALIIDDKSNLSFLERIASAPKPKRPPSETIRAVSLPRRRAKRVDLTEELKTPEGTMALRSIQSQALQEIRECRGLIAPIGVGHGKTLVALLSGTVLDAELAIILAPASTVSQLWSQHAEMGKHWRLPNTRIYSYSQLSQPKNTDLLPRLIEGHDPSRVVIVADEAHRIKRKEAARTKRILRFFEKNQDVMFVALSGTMTSKSLRDFSHLADLALRKGAPLPTDNYHLDAWCECIDVAGRPNNNHWRLVYPLWDGYAKQQYDKPVNEPQTYGYQERRDIIREAFKERLLNTKGVIATSDTSIKCSLLLRKETPTIPAELKETLIQVAISNEDPAGEPLEDDIATWRVNRYLSQGFFYVWDWPGEPDIDWLEARRRWHRYVRNELKHNAREDYDSPLLVFNRVKREYDSGARYAIHRAFQDWCEQKHKKAPPTIPVWLDKFLIKEAVQWAERQKEPVILWYDTKAVGEALEEYLPVYGAGAEMPKEAITCAMSIQAHGVGKNLQAWSNQLVISPPSSGKTWEQLLGRLHRLGQDADEVKCTVYVQGDAFEKAFEKAVEDALYIQGASGNRQKLLYATWEEA